MNTNIISALKAFFQLIEYLIIVDALSSWFIKDRNNRFSRTIGVVIDPIMIPCRKLQKRFLGNSPMDFSPVLGIVLIEIIRSIVLTIIG